MAVEVLNCDIAPAAFGPTTPLNLFMITYPFYNNLTGDLAPSEPRCVRVPRYIATPYANVINPMMVVHRPVDRLMCRIRKSDRPGLPCAG